MSAPTSLESRSFVRRTGPKAQVVWTDADGITFATFDDAPPELDLSDPTSLDAATKRDHVPWADVRKVQKSESRAIHVASADGAEHFATWSADEIWNEIRAHTPELQPGKAAAPNAGRGWWLKLAGGTGALGAAISALVHWLGGQAWLWESPHGRVRLQAAAIVWLVRALAWLGPWPWIAVTVLVVAFALFAAVRPGAGLPDDDVLVRE